MISATIIGNVGHAEQKTIPGGASVLEFTVASNEKQKGADVTTWVRCSWFGERAKAVAEYVTKGKPVAVAGTLSQREYIARDGARKTSLEMRVSELKLLGSGERGQSRDRVADGIQRSFDANHAPADAGDDDIPF
jgi:single-strand DNA-binding protein